ncbi:MAG TPA: GGDEF domain-containing protein [Candidatus Saccharimonadales bacterium]|nr:GGDEF domain-containing protein [Candidatus Saccharimonadales bacterium]
MHRWGTRWQEGLLRRKNRGSLQEVAEAEWAHEAADLARHEQTVALRENIAALTEKTVALEALEMRLRYQATHDHLTGVLNKGAFEAAVADLLKVQAEVQGAQVVLLLFDLNDFKGTNDAHGHSAGDKVLAGLGGHLNTRYRRATDVTGLDSFSGRLGGDEFAAAILLRPADPSVALAEGQLPRDTSPQGVLQYAQASLFEFGEQMNIELPGHWHGATIGMAVSTWESPLTYQQLFNEADAAMYASKPGRQAAIPRARTPDLADIAIEAT